MGAGGKRLGGRGGGRGAGTQRRGAQRSAGGGAQGVGAAALVLRARRFAAAELAAPAGVTVDAALGVSASEALLASVASLLVTNAAPASDEAVYVHADLASGGTTSATISPAPATAAFTSALSAGYVQAGNPLAICEPRRRPRTDARRATIHGVATSACQRREMRARCTSSCGVTLHLLLWCFI